MVDFLALTLIATLILAGLSLLWSLNRGKKGSTRAPFLALAVVSLAALLFVLASTELFGKPIIDVSLATLLTRNGPALLSLLGVEMGILIILVIAGKNKQREEKTMEWISIWFVAIAVVSFAGIFMFNALPAEGGGGTGGPEVVAVGLGAEGAKLLLELAAETLPDGFTLQAILPEGTLDRPTNFVAGPQGEIYISLFDGGIVTLDPAWQEALLIPFSPEIPQITGMAYHGNSLYADGSGFLFKLTDADNDGSVDSTEILLEGMASRTYDHHSNNGIAFGPDGRLYIALGGTTDHGPELDPLAGSILVFDESDGSLAKFAIGQRNPYDLAFCPSESGALYATDNGPDALNETLRFVPPDELNLIVEGKNYGYPDDFGFPPPWSDTESPIALMEIAGVPTGIVCYEGAESENAFPTQYQQNLFVSLAGGSNPETGHKIVRVELTHQGEQTIGLVSDFVTGLGRPVDILQYRDGSLLVLDYDLGQIYQITYTGNR